MKLLCNNTCEPAGAPAAKGWTLLSTALVLFMPKCALCWAAYLSFFSSFGLVIPYRPWFMPVVIILFMATLVKLLIGAIREKKFLAFVLALIAGALIVIQRNTAGDWLKITAIILMSAAVMMDNILKLFRLLKFDKVFR